MDGYGPPCTSSDKSFLFTILKVAYGCFPMIKLRVHDSNQAIKNNPSKGPVFGEERSIRSEFGRYETLCDLAVSEENVTINLGHTYEKPPKGILNGKETYKIKEMEIFGISKKEIVQEQVDLEITKAISEAASFAAALNDALNHKLVTLRKGEETIARLERKFEDEESFIR